MTRGGAGPPAAFRYVPALLLTTFILWPARGWSILGGMPLEPIGIAALCGVWLHASIHAGGARDWRVPAALVLVKIAAGVVAPQSGLVADYYANDRWTPPFERSVDFRGRPYSRIDREIAFGASAPRDLPLFFLNDIGRFNFYQPADPDRRLLPYSIAWTGQWFNDREDQVVRLFVEGRKISARLLVDRFEIVALDPAQTIASQDVRLRGGWRQVDLLVAAPYGADRTVSAGVIHPDGRQSALSQGVYIRRYPAWRMSAGRVVRAASLGMDILFLLWLGVVTMLAIRERAASAHRDLRPLFAAAAIVEALWFARPWAGRLMLLGGGGDPMTYEFQSRDILLNGILMNGGRPPGAGEPFYYQPLYAYALAALHWISGEGFFGIVFAQRLLLWATVALVWRITAAVFGERAGRVGLLVAFVFCAAELARWSDVLLTETIFIPLLCAWVLLMIRVTRTPERSAVVWAGVAGGLAALARSTAVLAWPFGLALIRTHEPSTRRAAAAAIAIVMLAIAGLATARNWIVARQFVPVTSSFAINLFLGNEPPTGTPVHAVAEHRGYGWFARDDRIRMVLEFARHSPALFLRGLWRKLLYSLGLFGALVPGTSWAPALTVTWMSSVAGTIVAWRRRADRIAFLPLAVALSQLAAVVVVFPHVYVDRLLLPLYVLLLPYCALAVDALVLESPTRAAAA